MTRAELRTDKRKPRRWNSWQAARRYIEDAYTNASELTIEIYHE